MATTRKTTPTPDPLADLREQEAPAGPPAPSTPPPAADAPPADGEVFAASYTVDLAPTAATALVAAWHRDRVTAGNIHNGGVCICAHMARVALTAIPAHIEITMTVDPVDPEGTEDANE